jgi:hypothetical protein
VVDDARRDGSGYSRGNGGSDVTTLFLALALFAQLLPPSLGSSVSAFENVLGGPNDASIGAYLHYQRCAGTDVDQFVLMAPNDQVWTIQRAWCDFIQRSVNDRFADASLYVPPDALPGAPFASELGEPGQTYVSATLAYALPSSLFHDCTASPVPAGSLFVVADNFGGWYMGPGTCPEHE